MGQLVGLGRRIAFGVPECLGRRKLDQIGPRGVIGHVPTVAEGSAGAGKEVLGSLAKFQGLALGFGLDGVVIRQAFDLLHIKDGVSLHERDVPLHVFALVIGFDPREAIGVDHERAMLALSDLGVEFGRLLVGHPDTRCVTLLHRFAPKQENVDATVGRAVVAKWSGDAAFGITGIPRF